MQLLKIAFITARIIALLHVNKKMRLFCFVLFCFVLFYFILFYFISFHFVSFRFVLFCSVLFYFVLFCFAFRLKKHQDVRYI